MDKRAFVRHEVNFEVTLCSSTIKDHLCRVKDFCFGGMLLELKPQDFARNPNLTTLIRNDLIDIKVNLHAHGGKPAGEYSQSGKIARIEGLHIGIAFIKPNSSTIAGIQHLANVNLGNNANKMSASEFKSDGKNDSSHYNAEARKIARTKYSEKQEYEILNKTLGFIQKYFSEKVSAYFKQLNDDFQHAIEFAKDNAEQNELFDASNKFKKYAQKAESDIKQKIIVPFQDYALKNSFDLSYLKKDSASQKLSLIDKGDFEDWLVVKVMATKVETSNSDALQELQIRFGELSGLANGVQNNPISPAVICYAFNETISKLPIDTKIRKLVYSSFEQNIAFNLKDFYKQLNEFLGKQGVLEEFDIIDHIGKLGGIKPRQQAAKPTPPPEQKTNQEHTTHEQEGVSTHPNNVVPFQQSTSGSQQASAQTHSGQASSSGHDAGQASSPMGDYMAGSYTPFNNLEALATSPQAHAQPQALKAQLQLPESASQQLQQFNVQQQIARNAAETVKNLINNYRKTSSNVFYMPKVDQSIPVFEPVKVTSTLQNLQAVEINEEDQELPLSQRVQNAIQEINGEAGRIDDAQASALNLIERLFESILDLENMNDDVKAWIKKLEIPFVKLLLADENFLQDLEHPARQVLNTIAKLGRSGVMANPNNAALVSKSLKKLVEEFNNDISVFNSANHELQDLLERQEKMYKKNLERVREAAQGQFKMKAAKRFVNEMLEDSITERDVPKALASLLDAGWRDLLDITVVKQGTDSESWNEYENVIHSMIQLLNPNRENIDLRALLSSIKKGMNAVSASGEFNDQKILNELKQLIDARKDENIKVATVHFPSGTFHQIQSEHSDVEDVWLRRASNLEIGNWLEVDSDASIFSQEDIVTDNEGNPIITKAQMRLAWHDEDSEEFVFVNHQGMKVIDVQVAALASLMKEGKAVLIDDQNLPVVDLGLDRMVQKFYEQLVHHASHDELTGLKNRRELERQIKHALTESRQQNFRHALALFDFNQVTQINEELGYDAGDELLKQFAKLISKNTPKNSVVARLSRDQFGLLLPKVTQKTSSVIFKNLKKQINEFVFTWEDKNHSSKCAAGSTIINQNSNSVYSIMEEAQKACDKARQSMDQKNETHIVETEGEQTSNALTRWLNKIDSAISNNRLQLKCQKIKSLKDENAPTLYEMLLSIKDENDEELNIAEFIHAAECSEKMQLLDRWAIKNVLSWMESAPDIVKQINGFGINLSGHSLNDDDLLYFIFENMVEQSHVPRQKVCFEVTESTAVNNLADLADFMKEMQNIGCRFSLDNFGSETSSYHFLKKLSLNYVKLDGEFVKNIASNETDYAMVKSMNDMVHFLGKQTVANDVNDKQTLEALKEIGVDYVQGMAVEAPFALANLR